MSQCKKSLKRSILVGTIGFILLLGFVLSIAQFSSSRKMLYSQYEMYIENILNYVSAEIDVDDMKQCIETGEESDQYRALQVILDKARARLDIHFIYVIIPLNTEPVDNIQNVIAGVSEEERMYLADQLVYLNMMAGDSYSPETAKKYLDAYESGKLSFFEEKSEWGDDYTGLLPLFDSEGNKVAALCVDVDIAQIHAELGNKLTVEAALLLLGGAAFLMSFMFWTDRYVTTPIEQLESSVVEFASKCKGQRNPDALTIDVSAIQTENEVETLARAVSQMSESIRDYVKNIQYTENELARMIVLANKDALTSVRNTNAFTAYKIELNARLRNEDLSFAVLMLDLNDLKKVNDTYGHEKGDQYIVKNCGMICEVFNHSPVFRIGGDEFAVVLMGQDYENRYSLLDGLRRTVGMEAHDDALAPWERFSVAAGMTEYDPVRDRSVEDVLRRADAEMYRQKEAIKAAELITAE